jgi:hypothetical protein
MIYEGVVGHQFSATFTLDGAVLDLTGATIVLRLRLPDETTSDKTASTTMVAGQAAYSTIVTDLTPAGRWQRQWVVTTSGGSVYYSQIVPFLVSEHL